MFELQSFVCTRALFCDTIGRGVCSVQSTFLMILCTAIPDLGLDETNVTTNKTKNLKTNCERKSD